jgi:hypothetical protein
LILISLFGIAKVVKGGAHNGLKGDQRRLEMVGLKGDQRRLEMVGLKGDQRRLEMVFAKIVYDTKAYLHNDHQH